MADCGWRHLRRKPLDNDSHFVAIEHNFLTTTLITDIPHFKLSQSPCLLVKSRLSSSSALATSAAPQWAKASSAP